MKNTLFLICAILCSVHVTATNLVVELTNSKQQSHDVSIIGKWLFVGKDLQLIDKEGNLLASESVLNIRKIVFVETSDDVINIPISEQLIVVYPNPTQDILHIMGSDGCAIGVYNTNGVLLQKTNERQVDVSNYPSGIYLLQIGTQVVRFIKQ